VKDTLKISGVQVSPSEIEVALMAQPDGLIEDVVVAGVSGGRTSDEKVPRAWIVLSQSGKRKGATATIKVLEEWSQQCLAKQKLLRGGFEVAVEVCASCLSWWAEQRLTVPVCQIPKSPTGKVLRRVLQDAYERKWGPGGSKPRL
jgi:acyl-CoA synthetase (AMP-forming)/AMP-acid ligase II